MQKAHFESGACNIEWNELQILLDAENDAGSGLRERNSTTNASVGPTAISFR